MEDRPGPPDPAGERSPLEPDRFLPPVIPAASPAGSTPSPPGSPGLPPFLSIWVRPRQTMRFILATRPRRFTILLALMGGVAGGLGNARSHLLNDRLPLEALLTVLIVAGGLGGIIGLYVSGLLLRLTSRWLEGRGDAVATRAAIAWSNLPAIWGLLLWVPMGAAFGLEGFRIEPADLEGNLPGLALIVLVYTAQAVIGVWGFIILLKCLGEAQGFSAWRALGAVALAALLAGAPLALAGLIVARLVSP